MKRLSLTDIKVKGGRIEYVFEYSEQLRLFFSSKPFVIEYPEQIASVPNAVLAIPFVCNVLPIIWLEDAELIIPELDEDFFLSIPDFKKGYIDMFPDATFKGTITVGRIVRCSRSNQCGAAAFFSGGLDAVTTLLRHLDEQPDLISIQGSDITYDNAAGWKPVQEVIDNTASEYGLKHINIHSSFRQFDSQEEPSKKYCHLLHDGWWHGVKHGIGLIGHAAPYIWLRGLKTIYIASSHCAADGKVTCASNPSIDNFVKFCGADVVHDGYELSWQDKVNYVVNYHQNHPEKAIRLHVCWESSDGNNCCHCEKCYRTMMSIWIEGEDPRDYGFSYPDDVFPMLFQKICLDTPRFLPGWFSLQEGAREHRKMLMRKPYYNDIKWIETFNFAEPQKNWCRKWAKIKNAKEIRAKLSYFAFYQTLRKIKRSRLFYPLRRLRAWLREKKKSISSWAEVNLPIGSKYFIIGTPAHTNIGDSAIFIAEKKLLNRCIPKEKMIKEITTTEYPLKKKLIHHLLGPRSYFHWNGGGNMGDQWFGNEQLRRQFIVDHQNSKIVIFPQTIYYTPTKDGRRKQQDSIAVYNHKNVHIIAREKKSYEIMKDLYPQANILLTPDIVLSTTMADYGVSAQERSCILWVMRSDAEKSMTDEMQASLMEAISEINLPIVRTDMYSDCPVNKENRTDCVRKKMQEFCGAKLVITDRLHAMIFAAITGTPCIVFSNYNHKVKGTYDWISYLPYVHYSETTEDAIEAIPTMLQMENCQYDNTPLLPYFEKLKAFLT